MPNEQTQHARHTYLRKDTSAIDRTHLVALPQPVATQHDLPGWTQVPRDEALRLARQPVPDPDDIMLVMPHPCPCGEDELSDYAARHPGSLLALRRRPLRTAPIPDAVVADATPPKTS